MSEPPKPNIRGFINDDDLVMMQYGKQKAPVVSTTRTDHQTDCPNPDVQVWKRFKGNMKTADARTMSIFKSYAENKSWSGLCDEGEDAPHIRFIGKVRASLLPF